MTTKEREALYASAKAAKTGEKCKCPGCNTPFVKASYQQAFCKTHKGTVCKDKYWNTVTPGKRNNTTRISPANSLYYTAFIEPKIELAKIRREQDKEDLMEIELNDDGGWDAHQGAYSRCKWCERLVCQCRDNDY